MTRNKIDGNEIEGFTTGYCTRLQQSCIWNSIRKQLSSKTATYAGANNEGIFKVPTQSKVRPPPSASHRSSTALLSDTMKWQTRRTAHITGQLPTELDSWRRAPASLLTRFIPIRESGGLSNLKVLSYSDSAAKAGSVTTSHGARAGMATKFKLGSPISFLANRRKGLSMLYLLLAEMS